MKQEAWFVRGFETAGHKRSAETELVTALLFISERFPEQPHRTLRRICDAMKKDCTAPEQKAFLCEGRSVHLKPAVRMKRRYRFYVHIGNFDKTSAV